jgi:hypothetical protein
MKHTPEPWKVDGKTVYALTHHSWRKGQEILQNRFSANVQDAHTPNEELQANAYRIVACVNACTGMEDPETSIMRLNSIIYHLRADADRLAEALERLERVAGIGAEIADPARSMARYALSKHVEVKK